MPGSLRRSTWILAAAFAAVMVGCVSTAPSPAPSVAPTRASAPADSPVAASPSPMPVATPDLTPVPGSPSIEPTPVPQDINQLELPTPACPSPGTAGEPPAVRVAIGGAAPIIATPGSSELRTCSTVGTSDATGEDPKVGVTAHAGDKLTLSVPAGWSILAYQSSDHPAGGEETNPRPLVILPAASTSVQLLVPKRSGRSIVDVVLAVVSDSGQVVGRIDARFQVKVG